ncbi:MAG: six-cysteine ranthipeptide SCIFF [Tissierellia bacterium]|nr:six-cysteine ranthipeptide SCIFF [Tissierellia bacterium]
MKHITVLKKADSRDKTHHAGCGECQTSCQSACKTSCTVGNQHCESIEEK